MREIVDPDKTRFIIDAEPYFSEETTPDSMRVGSVTNVELTQPPTADNKKPGEATIRVTLLVGDSDVVAGAEIPKASSDELDEDFNKRRETVKSLMEAIGQAAAQLMLVSFSELSKGIILIVEPEKRKKPNGDSHQTITINSPDSSAE